MRMKLLRAEGEGAVVLVCPSTLEEYRRAFELLGRPDSPGRDGIPVPAPPAHGRAFATSGRRSFTFERSV